MAATTAMVLTGLSAGMSVLGGMQQNAAAKQQANQVEASAMLRGQEQARVSAAQAHQESKEAESARRLQKIQYLKSGVSLEGSPLLMMEATRLQGERNIDEIIASGAAGVAGINAEGRMAADNYRASGRQAFMSGIGSAAKSVGGMKFGGGDSGFSGTVAGNSYYKGNQINWKS